MRVLSLQKPESFVWEEGAAAPAPGPGQALVRVRTIGICGTDLHAFRGRQPFFSYPRILGHELAVEVVALGEGTHSVAVGDRCAVNPYLNCGKCSACLRGKTNCCESLKVLGVHTDGGMRDEFVMPSSHLYAANDLTDTQLALVETLGIGCHATGRANVQAGEKVLVIGAGPIGLSVIEFLRIQGADISVLDLSPARREFCRKTYGIEAIYDSADTIKQGPLPIVVFDCTGNPASMNAAFSLLGHGGRLVFVGLFIGDVTFHDPDFHRKEVTLLATRNCTAPEHQRILELIRAGRIDTRPWVSDVVSADGLVERFPFWLDPANGVVKAVVNWL